jgi:putative two-component system response regulator
MISPEKGNIMVVDDTPANLKLLADMLGEHGYEVRPLPSGKAALKAASIDPPDLILLDINMPEMKGYEVCERLKADPLLREIPVIFISALNEIEDKIQAFRHGGVDYVTKPFQFEEVLARVETHLTLRRYQAVLQRHNTHLSELVNEQVKDILVANEKLVDAQLATIVAMSRLAETRDSDTGQHIERTQSFCRMLACELRNTPQFADMIDTQYPENIYNAAPLHDIGKVAILDAILLKPGKLTVEEFEIMKTHTTIGAQTLQSVQIRHPDNVLIALGIELAYTHHEKWNGEGYPRGLSGDNIPLSGRIMALADVYDALTSARCYKNSFTHEQSCAIIAEGRGTQFDPAVTDAFFTLEKAFRETRQRMNY